MEIAKNKLPYEISIGMVSDKEDYVFISPYVNGQLYTDPKQIPEADFTALMRMVATLEQMMSDEMFRRHPKMRTEYENIKNEQSQMSLN